MLYHTGFSVLYMHCICAGSAPLAQREHGYQKLLASWFGWTSFWACWDLGYICLFLWKCTIGPLGCIFCAAKELLRLNMLTGWYQGCSCWFILLVIHELKLSLHISGYRFASISRTLLLAQSIYHEPFALSAVVACCFNIQYVCVFIAHKYIYFPTRSL